MCSRFKRVGLNIFEIIPQMTICTKQCIQTLNSLKYVFHNYSGFTSGTLKATWSVRNVAHMIYVMHLG